jgi:hypothetical protein
VVFTLSGCGEHAESSNPGSGATAPAATSTAAPTGSNPTGANPTGSSSPPSLFSSTDEQLGQLVNAEAAWHRPSSLRAGETSRIGLSIGNSAALNTDIQSLLPSTSTQDAGTVAVGPNVSATLEVDPEDASVDPSTAINASTGSDIQLLWTWYVHPKHPTDDLEVTAHIAVTLSDNTVKTVDVPLSIEVHRTASYTFDQIFSDWETWVSIVTVAGGAVLFVWRRRRRLLELVNRDDDGAHGGEKAAGGAEDSQDRVPEHAHTKAEGDGKPRQPTP